MDTIQFMACARVRVWANLVVLRKDLVGQEVERARRDLLHDFANFGTGVVRAIASKVIIQPVAKVIPIFVQVCLFIPVPLFFIR